MANPSLPLCYTTENVPLLWIFVNCVCSHKIYASISFHCAHHIEILWCVLETQEGSFARHMENKMAPIFLQKGLPKFTGSSPNNLNCYMQEKLFHIGRNHSLFKILSIFSVGYPMLCSQILPLS